VTAVLTAERIASLLGLVPLRAEGGYFAETYRSAETVPASALPPRYRGERTIGTAIYYLLTPDAFSALHRLRSDEVFHFYLGHAVEMLHLWPDGSGRVVVLGPDLERGMRPQIAVPQGVWQGARLVPGGTFALLGTTVAPGFEHADYEGANREELAKAYAQFEDLIVALTRRAEP
jgi:uncharacterized protein